MVCIDLFALMLVCIGAGLHSCLFCTCVSLHSWWFLIGVGLHSLLVDAYVGVALSLLCVNDWFASMLVCLMLVCNDSRLQ